MKKLIFFALFIICVIPIRAQGNRADLLQDLEKNQSATQNSYTTATLTSATRLFGAKDDLTTVIFIVPSGSTVEVIDSDSTYYHVVFEESEGYIFKRHATIDSKPVVQQQNTQQEQIQQPEQQEQAAQQQEISRFAYLENKYGSNMAARLLSGKIWKGMNSEMVRDSWGDAQKVNRVISGNIIKEEWIFINTWLYFENNTLVEWGPRRQ